MPSQIKPLSRARCLAALVILSCNAPAPHHADAAQSANRTGDDSPDVTYADQRVNKDQFAAGLNISKDTRIDLSKASKAALEANSKGWYKSFLKHCNDPNYIGSASSTVSGECIWMGQKLKEVTSSANPDVESLLLRACAVNSEDRNWCLYLGNLYADRKQYGKALLVYKADGCVREECVNEQASIYRSLNATNHLHEIEEQQCHAFFVGGACNALSADGEIIDENKWLADARRFGSEKDRESLYRQRRHQSEYDEARQQKADRNAAIAAVGTYIGQTAVNSYEQHQADIAQARTNIAVAQMQQQNAARGTSGYAVPASSGASSSGGTTTATKRSTARTTASNSDDASSSASTSDASSSAPSESSSNSSFNGSSTTYNPYSGTGEAPKKPTSGGYWVDKEYNVTEKSLVVWHADVSLFLENSLGNPSQCGEFVVFSNPDKDHPVYYGFSGVINERIPAGAMFMKVRWPTPYAPKGTCPDFRPRVSIKYFALY